MRRYVTPPVLLLLLLLVSPVRAADADPNLKVSYDSAKDSLSVDAKQVSLTALFKEIAKKSGVEITADAEVEKQVSSKFSGVTVEQGLRALGEDFGVSYVLYYKHTSLPGVEKTVDRLTAMRVLASGKAGGGQPVAFASPPQAAPYPAQAAAPEQSQRPIQPLPSRAPPNAVAADVPARMTARERLEKRLANLPPQERERIIRLEEERTKKREEQMQGIQRAREERARNMAAPSN